MRYARAFAAPAPTVLIPSRGFMNSIIDWFARNSVAANLLMIFLIVSGLFAGLTVKQEVFPEFSLDMVTIEVPYLGAAPEEVESAVAVTDVGGSCRPAGWTLRRFFFRW